MTLSEQLEEAILAARQAWRAVQGLLCSAIILGGLQNTTPDALRSVAQRTVNAFLAAG